MGLDYKVKFKIIIVSFKKKTLESKLLSLERFHLV